MTDDQIPIFKTCCRASGCRSSPRFAMANSTRPRCAGWCGTTPDGPVDGLILAATSGEGMSLGIDELERLVGGARAEISEAGATCRSASACQAPARAKMLDALDETAAWPIDGYLIASPYYTRPSQRGLVQHFTALADHASWPIVLYNIPYRTAVNLTNETLLQLADHPNIVGIKDCCADRAQSIDFLAPAAGRLSRADRRGRAISRGAERRRRRRHPAVGASRNRNLRSVRTLLMQGDRDGALARWDGSAD